MFAMWMILTIVFTAIASFMAGVSSMRFYVVNLASEEFKKKVLDESKRRAMDIDRRQETYSQKRV